MTWYAVPDGSNEKREFEVFNFTGAGGVALSMYNTDEVKLDHTPLIQISLAGMNELLEKL